MVKNMQKIIIARNDALYSESRNTCSRELPENSPALISLEVWISITPKNIMKNKINSSIINFTMFNRKRLISILLHRVGARTLPHTIITGLYKNIINFI